MWVAGTHLVEPSSAVFLHSLAESWIGSRAAMTWASTHIWDAGITNGGLTHCATMLGSMNDICDGGFICSNARPVQ